MEEAIASAAWRPLDLAGRDQTAVSGEDELHPIAVLGVVCPRSQLGDVEESVRSHLHQEAEDASTPV